jgi:hypothetical protein
MSRQVLSMRRRTLVNTDPQRRCYNGCHFSSELVWSAWEVLERPEAGRAADRLEFWRGLNDYAVKERGEGARCEFKCEPGLPDGS